MEEQNQAMVGVPGVAPQAGAPAGASPLTPERIEELARSFAYLMEHVSHSQLLAPVSTEAQVSAGAGPEKKNAMAGDLAAPLEDSPLVEACADSLAPVVAPLLARAENKLTSRKLWTLVGTVATLVIGNLPALSLSPVATWAIAGVAAIYISAQAIVDSAKAGGK